MADGEISRGAFFLASSAFTTKDVVEQSAPYHVGTAPSDLTNPMAPHCDMERFAMYSERQLEDYIFGHPETISPTFRIIGRQVRVPHGIIDLLGWDDGIVYVIELKAYDLCHNDLGQVLRYALDVRQALNTLSTAWWPGEERSDTFHQLWMEWFECQPKNEFFLLPYVAPLLIGNAIKRTLYAAACFAGCDVRVWNFKSGIGISHLKRPEPDQAWSCQREWPDWLYEIGMLIADYCEEKAQLVNES